MQGCITGKTKEKIWHGAFKCASIKSLDEGLKFSDTQYVFTGVLIMSPKTVTVPPEMIRSNTKSTERV